MPKKACCCTPAPPEESSCCRPIYQGCVDKKYTFEVLFKAKYPCFKHNINSASTEAQYTCLNNSSIKHSIPGNAETFILTIEYKITKPAEIYITDSDRNIIGLPYSCGYPYYACWPNFDPEIIETWPYSIYNGQQGGPPPFYNPGLYPIPCVGCNCLTNDTYSFCNFDEDKLKESCNCYEGSFITQTPTQFWNQCYSYWILRPPNTDYEGMGQDPPNSGCYSGCTFTPGNPNISDIANSYSFQFIPDPNIPEQNLASYVPRLQPDVLNFQTHCLWDPFNSNYATGYNITLELGIGYKASFNCGNNVTEIVDIPFQQRQDSFTGLYNDGIYVQQHYRRSSLTNDPMNSCVPETSYNYPYSTNNCINATTPGTAPIVRCYDPQTNLPSSLYKDEWSNCLWGPPIPIAGNLDFGLISIDSDAIMKNYCEESFVEINWANHCQYFNLTDDIVVEST